MIMQPFPAKTRKRVKFMSYTKIAAIYADSEALSGQTVTVGGWVRTIRDMKTFGFIELNDGSCFKNLQVVMEAGTLEHIDDEGRFHVRQSDGDHRILTLGEDTFSVHPPESQLKLYMPLTADFYARNEWGDMDESGEEWDGRSLLDYEDGILSALVWNRMPEEAERGLMHWYGKEDNLDAKVRSAVFTVEARDGVLWGVAECQVLDTLSPQELNGLKDYIEGQASDGWGEEFEQREIQVEGGELYVHLWQSEGWSIQTEAERFGQTQTQKSHDSGIPTEMSEPYPQGEAKDMKHGTTMTMGGMSRG
jgi:hypothetical protein